MKTNTIAIVNQKGGVGKTTSTINIAGELAGRNYKVLIIDMDSQGNSTQNVGVENAENYSIIPALLEQKSINEIILKTEIQNIDLVPGSFELKEAETEINDSLLIKNTMDKLNNKYDFIIIDCPPSLGALTVNVLCYVEHVLVPIKTDINSLHGYNALIDLIKAIKQEVNSKLNILGQFVTVFNSRTLFDRKIYSESQLICGEKFIDIPIRMNVDIKEAPFFGLPICLHNNSAKGAEDYRKLTDVILTRLGLEV